MINFKSTKDQVFLVQSLLWMYDKLNDYISGSGATDEDTKRLKEIKDWIEEKRAK